MSLNVLFQIKKFMLHVLPPFGRDRVVAKFLDDGIIAYTGILWVAIATLHGWYTRSNAKFFIVILTQGLDLIQSLCVILLSGSKETTTTDTVCYLFTVNEIKIFPIHSDVKEE